MLIKCKTCEKSCQTFPSRIKIGKGKFCGNRCYAMSLLGKSSSRKGIHLTIEQKIKVSKGLKKYHMNGGKIWNKGKPGYSINTKGKKRPEFQGHRNPHWRGGIGKMQTGYIRQYDIKRKSYITQHRLVAEQLLNRTLLDEEMVHHINEDKTDNRPENLYLFSSSGEHTAYHAKVKRREIKPITKSNLA